MPYSLGGEAVAKRPRRALEWRREIKLRPQGLANEEMRRGKEWVKKKGRKYWLGTELAK